ncbi:YopX family protein [Mammaliicoccus sciuri]|uniref:YopX family protein n=1 Tax=Mammaliicoccus sciuri TaxID=1296 RepID=UPI00385511D2
MITKFRAYLNLHKKIVDVQEINYKYKEIVWVNGKYTEVDNFEDVELLQSTGLFDKNDKEIYEGDIIDKGYSNIDIVDRIGYVKFGTGDDSDGYLNQEWLGWTTNNDDSLLDVHEHCTVLGNKFEHPHLLGED